MAFLIGVLLFAVAIIFSVAAHEAGHMTAARVFGMNVRRYFVGFGPTLWSTRRGNTEYGLKALPLGGFCDIAGMTKLDELEPEEEPRAMYNFAWWKRVIVMLGGIIVNIVLALVLIYGAAVTWGLPPQKVEQPATVQELACAPASQNHDGTLADCNGAGPAERSGIRPGDTFRAVNGQEVKDFPGFTKALDEATQAQLGANGTKRPGDEVIVPVVVDRGGQAVNVNLKVEVVERLLKNGDPKTTGAVGVKVQRPDVSPRTYNPISAMGGTLKFTGTMVNETLKGLASLPARFPGVVASIFGGERADDSPMSVVGASRVGGELARHNQWLYFTLSLASLNLFLAGFNLVPLPPLDGGHIAVIFFEKVRDFFRRRRGLQPGGPADYTKLMPLTYAAMSLLVIFGATVIVADVVNPIRLF